MCFPHRSHWVKTEQCSSSCKPTLGVVPKPNKRTSCWPVICWAKRQHVNCNACEERSSQCIYHHLLVETHVPSSSSQHSKVTGMFSSASSARRSKGRASATHKVRFHSTFRDLFAVLALLIVRCDVLRAICRNVVLKIEVLIFLVDGFIRFFSRRRKLLSVNWLLGW